MEIYWNQFVFPRSARVRLPKETLALSRPFRRPPDWMPAINAPGQSRRHDAAPIRLPLRVPLVKES